MLTELQNRAIALLALNQAATRIAKDLDIGRSTLYRWKELPEFRARLEEAFAETRRQIRTTGAAVKEVRIRAKKRRLNRFYNILAKRAGNPERGGAEWDETGFMVRREACIGGGQHGKYVVEYEFDKTIADAILDVENSIADELGERHKVVDHNLRMQIGRPSDRAVAVAQVLEIDQMQLLLSMAEKLEDESGGEPTERTTGEVDAGADPQT